MGARRARRRELKGPLRDTGPQESGSSVDDDSSDQDILGAADLFATALHVFHTEVDGFAEVVRKSKETVPK